MRGIHREVSGDVADDRGRPSPGRGIVVFHGVLCIGVVNPEFEAPDDDFEQESPGEEHKTGWWLRMPRRSAATVKELESSEEIPACIGHQAGEPSNSRQLAAQS